MAVILGIAVLIAIPSRGARPPAPPPGPAAARVPLYAPPHPGAATGEWGTVRLQSIYGVTELKNGDVWEDLIKYSVGPKIYEAEKLIYDETISEGMIPKIRTCINAVNNGVRGVVVIDGRKPHSILFELFSDKGFGTLIRK